jgi:acetyltransferase-like isoleucine patch superfamily enzyme
MRFLGSLVAALKGGYAQLRLGFLRLLYGKQLAVGRGVVLEPGTEVILRGNNPRIRIGSGCCVMNGVVLSTTSGQITLGSRVYINRRSILISRVSIAIGDGTIIGPHVMIFDNDHAYRKPDLVRRGEFKTAPITIGKRVWVGANVVVLRGTEIGDDCVVAAGAVLRGKYPPNALIASRHMESVTPIDRLNAQHLT